MDCVWVFAYFCSPWRWTVLKLGMVSINHGNRLLSRGAWLIWINSDGNLHFQKVCAELYMLCSYLRRVIYVHPLQWRVVHFCLWRVCSSRVCSSRIHVYEGLWIACSPWCIHRVFISMLAHVFDLFSLIGVVSALFHLFTCSWCCIDFIRISRCFNVVSMIMKTFWFCILFHQGYSLLILLSPRR